MICILYYFTTFRKSFFSYITNTSIYQPEQIECSHSSEKKIVIFFEVMYTLNLYICYILKSVRFFKYFFDFNTNIYLKLVVFNRKISYKYFISSLRNAISTAVYHLKSDIIYKYILLYLYSNIVIFPVFPIFYNHLNCSGDSFSYIRIKS